MDITFDRVTEPVQLQVTDDSGAGYIVISDGVGSLKVYTQASADIGRFVRATGVIGAETQDGLPVGVLRCRATGDVVVEL